MQKRPIIGALLCAFCLLMNTRAWAQSSLDEDMRAMKAQFSAIQAKMETLEARVAAQQKQIAAQEETKTSYENRIRELEAQLASGRDNAVSAAPSQPAIAQWLPDIGVVGDVLYTQNSSKEDAEGADRVSVRGVELVVGSAVDPYSRFDATIAFSDVEDPALEEGYLTRFGLPFDSTARLGKFKPKAGKALAVHRHVLDTVDEPLVIQQYFGVEGMNKSGLDVTTPLDLPWPVAQQVTLGVLEGGNGEEGTAFGDTRRRPTVYSHLKNYVDVGESTGLELGFSHMTGSRDEDASFEVQVLGSDLTLTQYFNANQSLKLQGEVFNLSRRETEGFDGNLWGGYALADFRFHPSFSTGFRYDAVQPVDNDRSVNPEKDEQGYTGYLTYHQSEFARWRVQFTHKELVTGKDDNTVYLQGTFTLGKHEHKLQ